MYVQHCIAMFISYDNKHLKHIKISMFYHKELIAGFSTEISVGILQKLLFKEVLLLLPGKRCSFCFPKRGAPFVSRKEVLLLLPEKRCSFCFPEGAAPLAGKTGNTFFQEIQFLAQHRCNIESKSPQGCNSSWNLASMRNHGFDNNVKICSFLRVLRVWL